MEITDVEGFIEVVKDFDSFSRLDQWFTNILPKVKKKLEEAPDLF